ncbi:MAG: PqqD family protein [Ignavibacteriaceae bacterium]|nr:PqqD family protein [Ignavibacteriaceae bacterium]
MKSIFKDYNDRKKLKGIDALELTSVKIQEVQTGENGIMTVLIPRFKWSVVHNYMVKNGRDPNFRLDLDEIGSEVWVSIDGKRKVKEVGEKVKEKLGDRIEPRERLVKFVSMMYHNKIITFKELEN